MILGPGGARHVDDALGPRTSPNQAGFAVAKQPGKAVVRVEDRATHIAHEVKVEVVP
jgi:hypothetical protein